ncbi:MAG: DNA methyltransferase [Burkholderiaceae bacterium]
MKLFPNYKTVSVASLVPYARNSRTHSPQQVDKIAASIREFGFLNPIIVDGENGIIAGHGRVMAAQKLGLADLPVIEASHLTEAQRRAYVIADNRLALDAGWDNDLLKIELQDLDSQGFDLNLTGFSVDEIANFLAEPTEGLTDEDAVPEVPAVPVTVEGDVWVLGRHRLMCGDSTSIDAVDRLLNGASIDLVHTDPPYGISESAAKRVSRETNSLAKSSSHLPEFNDATTDAARDAFALCEGMGIKRQVWWGANYYAHALPETANWFVWDKRVEEKQKDVNSDCELAWVKSKWSSVRIFRHLWKGLIKESEKGQARVHPTQKPVALVEWVIDYYRDVKTVLDLFGGSGSTLIGCEKKGCDAFLMELEPYYCDVIVKRWQDFTGQEATLEATGETYDQLKQKREAA